MIDTPLCTCERTLLAASWDFPRRPEERLKRRRERQGRHDQTELNRGQPGFHGNQGPNHNRTAEM